MTILERAIHSNQFSPYNMELRYIPLMNSALSQNTKDYIEHGNLDLRILAILIRDTLSEAKKEEQIDKILWDKLHDQDLVIRLMGVIL